MAKVRVEWVKVGRAGEARDAAFIEQIVGDPQDIDAIAAVQVLSEACPPWPSESGAVVDRGWARVIVIEGAVLASAGAPDVIEDAPGCLAYAGGPLLHLPVRAGQVLGFIEAEDAPASLEVDFPAGGATEEKQQALIEEIAGLREDQAQLIPALPPKPRRTDVANFRTKTTNTVSGADTDQLLAAGGAGQRQFVYAGTLQSDIDVTITFKAGANAGAATAIYHPIDLKAGEMLDLGDLEEPEIYTGVDEALFITKSTAATIDFTLFSKAA